jgi:Golgi CORVET complex core vacuolar protein 8
MGKYEKYSHPEKLEESEVRE